MTTTKITLLLIDVQNDFHPPGGSLAIPTAAEDAARIASFITKHAESINRIVATLDTHPKWHIAHPTFWTAGGDNPTTSSAGSSAAADNNDHYRHPAPFTVITSKDIRSKKWIPILPMPPPPPSEEDHRHHHDYTIPSFPDTDDTSLVLPPLDQQQQQHQQQRLDNYCAEYTHRLESSSHRKFSLTIWPEHCIVGTVGHDLVDVVARAILASWGNIIEDDNAPGGGDRGKGMEEDKKRRRKTVEYVRKGMNPYTEMYSAVCAEVPVDASTSFNYELVDSLRSNTDQLVICGQALSHCVNYTVRDIVSQWSSSSSSSSLENREQGGGVTEDNYCNNETRKMLRKNNSNITILKDCMSSVPGFEEEGEKFLQDMMELGVNVHTSDSFVALTH